MATKDAVVNAESLEMEAVIQIVMGDLVAISPTCNKTRQYSTRRTINKAITLLALAQMSDLRGEKKDANSYWNSWWC